MERVFCYSKNGRGYVDKSRQVCYYVIDMKLTQTLTQKYNQFVPGEFLPIYVEGKLDNAAEFHLYKAKRGLSHIAKALAPAAQRIDQYFTQH